MKRLIFIITLLALSLSCGGGFTPVPTGSGSVEITTSGTSLPAATAGQSYSFQLSATGGSGTRYVWTGSGLPKGLTLSASGLISGTPEQSGTFQVNVTAKAE